MNNQREYVELRVCLVHPYHVKSGKLIILFFFLNFYFFFFLDFFFMGRVNIALGLTLLAAGGMVYYVHRNQTSERERMRKGPVNDVLRRQKKSQSIPKDDNDH